MGGDGGERIGTSRHRSEFLYMQLEGLSQTRAGMAAACSELLMSPCTCTSALQPAVMLLLIHELLHALAWQHQWLWTRSRLGWSDLNNIRLQLKETAVASTTGCTGVATLERLVQSVRSVASQPHTRQDLGKECPRSLISLPCATSYCVSPNLSSLQLAGGKFRPLHTVSARHMSHSHGTHRDFTRGESVQWNTPAVVVTCNWFTSSPPRLHFSNPTAVLTLANPLSGHSQCGTSSMGSALPPLLPFMGSRAMATGKGDEGHTLSTSWVSSTRRTCRKGHREESSEDHTAAQDGQGNAKTPRRGNRNPCSFLFLASHAVSLRKTKKKSWRTTSSSWPCFSREQAVRGHEEYTRCQARCRCRMWPLLPCKLGHSNGTLCQLKRAFFNILHMSSNAWMACCMH